MLPMAAPGSSIGEVRRPRGSTRRPSSVRRYEDALTQSFWDWCHRRTSTMRESSALPQERTDLSANGSFDWPGSADIDLDIARSGRN